MNTDRCSLSLRSALLAVALIGSGSLAACSSDVTTGCLVNGDCAQGEQCVARKCVTPPKVCSADADCPSGQTCIQGLCGVSNDAGPVGCQTDEDCNATPATPLCISTKVCAECRTTADCGDSKKQCSDQHACVFTLGNCASDADCSASSLSTTPHCDTSDNSCVGCVDSGQCPSGYYCSMGTQSCQQNPVHRCSSDTDCSGTTPHCDTNSGLCQQCVTNSQCTGNRTCSNGSCGCTGDFDCQDGNLPVCNTTNGACVECVNDGQCSGGESCFSNTCQMLNGCSSSADCGVDETCQSGECVPATSSGGCTSDSDCAQGETCDFFGDCIPAGGCSSSFDCNDPSAPWCDYETYTCVECTSSIDCGSGQSCVNNTCTGGSTSGGMSCSSSTDCTSSPVGHVCDTTSGLCVQCSASVSCGSGKWCEAGVCVTGASQSCTTTSDCAATSTRDVCDTSIDLCVGCRSDADCPGSQLCFSGVCEYFGGSCTSSTDCAHDPAGTRCYNRSYCVECTRNSHCPGSQECIGNQCYPWADPYDCTFLIYCENRCYDQALQAANPQSYYNSCVSQDCEANATTTAVSQLGALDACLAVACPSGSSDSCYSAAQSSGGDCYAQLAACRLE